MEFVEHRAISTFHIPLKMWVRYIDNTFCVIDQQYAEEFHKHLNSISPSITFTLEREQNQSLAFLDVKVTRNRDNSISTTIYKKPTHTDRYLQFDSHQWHHCCRRSKYFGGTQILAQKICLHPRKNNKAHLFGTSIFMSSLFHINILVQSLKTIKNKIKTCCRLGLKL